MNEGFRSGGSVAKVVPDILNALTSAYVGVPALLLLIVGLLLRELGTFRPGLLSGRTQAVVGVATLPLAALVLLIFFTKVMR